MYGTETLQQAHRLINREDQYFGLANLGENMEGSHMHQQLLAAYRKVWPQLI
jgi:ribosomal protein S12 methylthiotransferase accessory factor